MTSESTIAKRAEGHGTNHYLVIVSVFKGVTLAAAAVSIGLIVSRGHWATLSIYIALIYWLASFLAMIVTYDGILNATMVSGRMLLTPVDIVAPFVSALLEFSLFSILGAVPWQGTGHDQLTYLGYWPLVFGAFGFLSFAIILNGYLNHTTAADASDDEIGVMLYYRRMLRQDLIGSAIGAGVGGVTAFLLLRVSAARESWQLIAAIYALAVMTSALVNLERTRIHITRQVLPGAQRLKIRDVVRN
jgi:hypothetical protein